jgi:hypothetical protein
LPNADLIWIDDEYQFVVGLYDPSSYSDQPTEFSNELQRAGFVETNMDESTSTRYGMAGRDIAHSMGWNTGLMVETPICWIKEGF